jgi:FolB domain-containing protein
MEPRPLDRLHIDDLRISCIIGVEAAERAAKQDVRLSVTLHADLESAGRTDNLGDTVDYSVVSARIASLIDGSGFHLIEAIAQRVADMCLEYATVARVDVRVEKPCATGAARGVAVEITRDRVEAEARG